MLRYSLLKFFIYFSLLSFNIYAADEKKIAYLVSDTSIPFWSIMAKGVESKAGKLGYSVDVYTAENLAKKELQNTVRAIREKVSAIVLSPTNSSAAVTVLKLTKKANIPVVISDIGTEGGEYVSFISSDNKQGAYEIGKVLTKEMIKRGWQNGSVGIISIPQKRSNGKERTAGFMDALQEANIKSSNLYQQVDFSYQETYDYTIKLINEDPELRAIWLQGSDKYLGALDAIKKSNKEGKILLICFDAEPIFLELIPKGVLVGAAMQQPFLMGEKAVESLDSHLKGIDVKKKQKLSVLAISKENIKEKLNIIKRNVLGLEVK